jgi:hypothetical protein
MSIIFAISEEKYYWIIMYPTLQHNTSRCTSTDIMIPDKHLYEINTY